MYFDVLNWWCSCNTGQSVWRNVFVKDRLSYLLLNSWTKYCPICFVVFIFFHVKVCISKVSLISIYHFFSYGPMQVALKTLIVIHRTLREGDPTFREELLNFSQRARILQLSNFKDDSSPIGIHLCLYTSWCRKQLCFGVASCIPYLVKEIHNLMDTILQLGTALHGCVLMLCIWRKDLNVSGFWSMMLKLSVWLELLRVLRRSGQSWPFRVANKRTFDYYRKILSCSLHIFTSLRHLFLTGAQ